MTEHERSKDALKESNAGSEKDLSVVRTRLAIERTQLAWVRTSFSLITAGFAIDQATAAMHRARLLEGTNWVKSSHFTGMVLIGASTLFLCFATASYMSANRQLTRLKRDQPPTIPVALLPASLVIVLGCALTILLQTVD